MENVISINEYKKKCNGKSYVVEVADNWYCFDIGEVYEIAEYPTEKLAIDACKRLLLEELIGLSIGAESAQELYSNWLMYGSIPYVVTPLGNKIFNVDAYVKTQCTELHLREYQRRVEIESKIEMDVLQSPNATIDGRPLGIEIDEGKAFIFLIFVVTLIKTIWFAG